MSSGKKRTGSKNVHQKDKYKKHPAIAEMNKLKRIEKDKKFKEKKASSMKHRHLWNYIKQISKNVFTQACKKCNMERTKKSKKD